MKQDTNNLLSNQNSKPIHVARAKRGKNVFERVTLGFSFASDWLKKVARVFLTNLHNQSKSELPSALKCRNHSVVYIYSITQF